MTVLANMIFIVLQVWLSVLSQIAYIGAETPAEQPGLWSASDELD